MFQQTVRETVSLLVQLSIAQKTAIATYSHRIGIQSIGLTLKLPMNRHGNGVKQASTPAQQVAMFLASHQ